MELILQGLLLVPVVAGSAFALLCVHVARRFANQAAPASGSFQPKVTVLKPVYGLEKGLAENLRSACMQDYPDFQVVLSVQRLDDPALPLLRDLEREFGPERVTVVAIPSEPTVNGKVQNLINAMTAARHDWIVISDSDVRLQPGYLRAIMAPLQDSRIGYSCTLYRAVAAETWFEELELLSYNAEFVPGVLVAYATGASGFCLGASVALQRGTLAEVGGFEALADYLVEDYELGRRILASGRGMKLVDHCVDLIVDLKGPRDWWRHQLYWDQNTWAARPGGFLATGLTRAVPFAFLFAAARLFDPASLAVLAAAVVIRTAAAAVLLGRLQDSVSARQLLLLPLRDLAGFVIWIAAMTRRRFTWRGHEFTLARDGRIVPRVP
jgi:ceramide glucosyltransferase